MTGHLHILFSPLLPVVWLAALGAGATVLAGFALFRRARGVALRIVLFALLLLALANPSLIGEKREPIKDTALVVIDDSASMKLGDRLAQAKRAEEAIAAKLAAFSDLDVETLHVAGEDETDLFRAIELKRSSIPAGRLAGIIAVTDGQIHDAPTSEFPAPFHALIAGQKGEVDRRLIVKAAPAYGIVGQEATLTLRVEDEPKAQSSNATVTITRDDGTSQTLTVPVGEDAPIKAEIKHGGANVLAFEAEGLPQELTAINNTATASINGIRDRLRVLLVSGEPHSGGRNWRNLLKADPAVDLVHFTILRSPLKDNSVPNAELSLIAFPSQEIFDTKLKNFDLVIFDGFGDRLLIPDKYLANIANYVENGGALLVTNATGEQAAELSQSPLSRVLPTVSNGELLTGSFVPTPTEAGKRHPVTATLGEAMPQNLWAPWYRQVDARVENSDSETVLTGMNRKPLLVLAHVGQGRVAQFLSNQFWLWARQYPQGGPQGELLRRTAHWLVQEPELDEAALRAHAERGGAGWQIVVTKQSLHDDAAEVVVTGPDNQPLQVRLDHESFGCGASSGVMPAQAGIHLAEPNMDSRLRGNDADGACLNTSAPAGTLRAVVPAKDIGLYHVKDDSREILVMAGMLNAPEFGAMVATEKVVAPVAKTSGGAVTWLADKPDAPDIRRTDKNSAQSGWGWIGLKKNGQYRVTGSTVYPLWPAWAAVALLLVVAMGVWRREGKN
jgi:hypothetical protein